MNEIIGARLNASLVKHLKELGFVVGSSVETIENVLTNISREQDRFLLDDADFLVIPLGV